VPPIAVSWSLEAAANINTIDRLYPKLRLNGKHNAGRSGVLLHLGCVIGGKDWNADA